MTAGHAGRVDYPTVVEVKTRDCFSGNFMQADDTDNSLLEWEGLETLGLLVGSEQQPVNKHLGSGGDNPYCLPCQRNQGNGSLSNFFFTDIVWTDHYIAHYVVSSTSLVGQRQCPIDCSNGGQCCRRDRRHKYSPLFIIAAMISGDATHPGNVRLTVCRLAS